MALGDVYRLVDFQTYDGQTLSNVYHYQNVNDPADAEALAQGFVEDHLPAIRVIQSPALEHTVVTVVNLNDEEDFHELAVGLSGNTTEAGQGMAAFICSRLILHRTSRAIRNGAKRYAGLVEGAVEGRNVNTSYKGLLDDLADALEVNITPIPSGEFELVLYGDVTPNRPAPIVVPISSVEAQWTISTQNSRKAWVGT